MMHRARDAMRLRSDFQPQSRDCSTLVRYGGHCEGGMPDTFPHGKGSHAFISHADLTKFPTIALSLSRAVNLSLSQSSRSLWAHWHSVSPGASVHSLVSERDFDGYARTPHGRGHGKECLIITNR